MDHASGAASPATSTEQQSLHSRNTRPTAADRDRDSIEPISQLSAPTTPLPGPSRAASSSSRHRSTPGNDYDARPTPVAKQFDTKSARAEENELPVPALADREKKPKSIGKWILFFLPRFDRKWLLLLLPIVPAGFAVNYTHGPSLVTFIVNFLAIIPMSLATGLCLKRVNIRIGPNLGGLLYITFSNLVQIVSSVLLLRTGQLDVLQTALIGGILCSVLLFLGASLLFGGLNRVEQHYNVTVAQTSAIMMMLAATSLIVPTVSHQLSQTSDYNLVRQSRGASVVLLVVYGAYIVFAYRTHGDIFAEPSQKAQELVHRFKRGEALESLFKAGKNLGQPGFINALRTRRSTLHEEHPGQFSVLAVISWLLFFAVLTAILGFNTAFAVDSISALTENTNVSKPFVGLVLLPILNNDLEPVSNAWKDEMDNTIQFTIGKCMQTALFVTPLMIIIAWGMGVELALYFDGFEVASLFTSVLLINYVLADGKSAWIHGVLLIGDWILVALAAWFAD